MSNLTDQPAGKQGKTRRATSKLGPVPVTELTELDRTEDLYAWKNDFIKEGDRNATCFFNAILALSNSPVWCERLAFDTFAREAVLTAAPPWDAGAIWRSRHWTDDDDVRTASWLQKECGIMASDTLVSKAVESVARDRPFHPIQDYLSALSWDGEERLDTWLSVYLGVQQSEISQTFGARFLVAAVARAFDPGCKVDTCLFLEGEQGKKKSTALSVLAGKDYFTDELPDIRDKDSAIQLLGIWIVELGEVAAFQGVPVSRVKQFLSRYSDRFRPPFGRRAINVPRGCVFAGTVNADAYLHDETGARRFWPVKTGDIRIEALEEDRDQLWAEAAARYHTFPCWWLDTPRLISLAKDEQAGRYDYDVWHDPVARWVAGRPDTSIDEVLECCLSLPPASQSQRNKNRVAAILRVLGFERYQASVEGRRPYRYRLWNE